MASEHDNKLHAQPEPRGDASAVREPATQEQLVTVVATRPEASELAAIAAIPQSERAGSASN